MTTSGIIASRYARALLLYVQETGEGARVAEQAERLERALSEVPEMVRLLDDPEAAAAPRKMELLWTALGADAMAPSLEKFLRLVMEKGRTAQLRLMLHDYIDAWNRSQHVLHAQLRAVTQPDEAFLERIRELVRKQTGCETVIHLTLDPGLIGGFVFEIEDWTLDASAARQLRRIRRQFIENNRRIV